MQEQINDTIFILPVSAEEDMYAGERNEDYDPLRGDDRSENKRAIPARLSQISIHMKEFFTQIETLLHEVPERLSEFSMDEIEISAGLTASGKFVLFGIGGEAGIEGGFRFSFKRMDKRSEEPEGQKREQA